METPEEFAKSLAEMTDEEFFSRTEPLPQFNPQSDDYQEVVWGTTPLGGDLSIVKFYDNDGNRCRKEEKSYVDIVVYTKEGEVVNSVVGKRPNQ